MKKKKRRSIGHKIWCICICTVIGAIVSYAIGYKLDFYNPPNLEIACEDLEKNVAPKIIADFEYAFTLDNAHIDVSKSNIVVILEANEPFCELHLIFNKNFEYSHWNEVSTKPGYQTYAPIGFWEQIHPFYKFVFAGALFGFLIGFFLAKRFD